MNTLKLALITLLAALYLCGCSSGNYDKYRANYRSLLIDIKHYTDEGILGPFCSRINTPEQDDQIRASRNAKLTAVKDKIESFKAKYRDEFRDNLSFRKLDVLGEADKYGLDIEWSISQFDNAQGEEDLIRSGLDGREHTQLGQAYSSLKSKISEVERILDEGK